MYFYCDQARKINKESWCAIPEFPPTIDAKKVSTFSRTVYLRIPKLFIKVLLVLIIILSLFSHFFSNILTPHNFMNHDLRLMKLSWENITLLIIVVKSQLGQNVLDTSSRYILTILFSPRSHSSFHFQVEQRYFEVRNVDDDARSRTLGMASQEKVVY